MAYSNKYHGLKKMSKGQRKHVLKTLRGYGWKKRKQLNQGTFR